MTDSGICCCIWTSELWNSCSRRADSSPTATAVATNASAESSANTSTARASQEASAVLTNANQVTPAVPVQAETVTEPAHEGQTVDMQILVNNRPSYRLVNYDYYQDKPSQTVGLSKLLFYQKASVKLIPIRSYCVGIRFRNPFWDL